MEMKTQQLTTFLSSCRGNWRNTIYIRDAASDGGYLMTADRDGVPLLVELRTLSRLMGEAIDPTECRGGNCRRTSLRTSTRSTCSGVRHRRRNTHCALCV